MERRKKVALILFIALISISLLVYTVKIFTTTTKNTYVDQDRAIADLLVHGFEDYIEQTGDTELNKLKTGDALSYSDVVEKLQSERLVSGKDEAYLMPMRSGFYLVPRERNMKGWSVTITRATGKVTIKAVNEESKIIIVK